MKRAIIFVIGLSIVGACGEAPPEAPEAPEAPELAGGGAAGAESFTALSGPRPADVDVTVQAVNVSNINCHNIAWNAGASPVMSEPSSLKRALCALSMFNQWATYFVSTSISSKDFGTSPSWAQGDMFALNPTATTYNPTGNGNMQRSDVIDTSAVNSPLSHAALANVHHWEIYYKGGMNYAEMWRCNGGACSMAGWFDAGNGVLHCVFNGSPSACASW